MLLTSAFGAPIGTEPRQYSLYRSALGASSKSKFCRLKPLQAASPPVYRHTYTCIHIHTGINMYTYIRVDIYIYRHMHSILRHIHMFCNCMHVDMHACTSHVTRAVGSCSQVSSGRRSCPRLPRRLPGRQLAEPLHGALPDPFVFEVVLSKGLV